MTETTIPAVIDAADLSDDDSAWLIEQAALPWEERTLPRELHPGGREDWPWHVFQKALVRLMKANDLDPQTVLPEDLHLVGDHLTYQRVIRDTAGAPIRRLTGKLTPGGVPDWELVTRTTTVTVKR